MGGIILEVGKRLVGALIGSNASKAGGALSGLSAMAAVVGIVAWFFGPGREWSITLNALELGFAVLAGSVLLEWFRRMPPPGSP
jgi:hypothetical protein